MIHDEMRTFGYLCPKCGKTVMGTRSVFALSASNAEVECDCGESRLQVKFDGETYQVYVPCGLCEETHVATCPPERMLHGATALGCSQTKQFSCFIGEEVFVDNVIMYEVLSELKEIAERPNGITCGCGSSHYGMQIRRSAVDLTCKDCGAKLRIPAATDRDLDDLCCHLKLVIPGR